MIIFFFKNLGMFLDFLNLIDTSWRGALEFHEFLLLLFHNSNFEFSSNPFKYPIKLFQQTCILFNSKYNSMELNFQFCFLCFLLLFIPLLQAQSLQTYIVQLHPHASTRIPFSSKLQWHLSFLEKFISSGENSSSRLLYSYHSAFEGFAALLSENELKALKKSSNVLSIYPERKLEVQTTYSYKFLGLSPTKEGMLHSL